MVKITVLYPHSTGARFDMDYYLNRHIPMVREKLGAACKSVVVEQGVSGGAAGSPPHYIVTAHFEFDTIEAVHAALSQHGATFAADIPNYTAIQPLIQISEVKLHSDPQTTT